MPRTVSATADIQQPHDLRPTASHELCLRVCRYFPALMAKPNELGHDLFDPNADMAYRPVSSYAIYLGFRAVWCCPVLTCVGSFADFLLTRPALAHAEGCHLHHPVDLAQPDHAGSRGAAFDGSAGRSCQPLRLEVPCGSPPGGRRDGAVPSTPIPPRVSVPHHPGDPPCGERNVLLAYSCRDSSVSFRVTCVRGTSGLPPS